MLYLLFISEYIHCVCAYLPTFNSDVFVPTELLRIKTSFLI